MSDQSKIKAKIAVLLAKAKGTDNEHEADTFLAKAMELLEQHQLSMADLEDADDPVRHDRGLDCTKWTASWQADIYSALARLYGCRVVKCHQIKGYTLELVGRESAIVTTELMFPWIKEQVNVKGRELFKAGGAPDAQKGARLVGNALTRRIWVLIREQEKVDGPRTEAVAKNALVTQDRVLQVMQEHFGDLSKGRKTKTSTSASAAALAGGIGLHRQAGEGYHAYLGGCDLDARRVTGATWSDLLDAIDEEMDE